MYYFFSTQNAAVHDLFAKLHEVDIHSIIAQIEAGELDCNDVQIYKNRIKNVLRSVR